jgi:formylglycine-generating enzyme required for sulfatase activity
VLSAGGTDNANFLAFNGSTYFYTDPTNMVTPVGVFAASPGPYGTHDMGGDVYQWEDTPNDDQFRFLQGFCWADGSEPSFYGMIYDPPTVESDDFGFRVASVPEPSTTALLLASAACLLGYIWRRRAAQHEEEKRMA